ESRNAGAPHLAHTAWPRTTAQSLLLRFRFQLPVFILQHDLFTVGIPARDRAVKLSIDVVSFNQLLALIIPLRMFALSFAVLKIGLKFLLAIGKPGFQHTVDVARNVMFFGQRFLARLVVPDPFAIA